MCAVRKSSVKDEVVLPESTQKFYCHRCGTAFSRQKGYFPVSHSPMYRGVGYLPICSDCIDSLYETYCSELKDDRVAMRRLCMKLDLYWSEDIFKMMEKTVGKNSRARNYIGKTNLLKYIDKNFDDTLKEEELSGIAFKGDYTSNNGTEYKEIPEKYIQCWGDGYDIKMYEELEQHYKKYEDWMGTIKPNEDSIIRQLCLLEVLIRRDSAAGRPIDKNISSYNNLLGSANLKPVQMKDLNDGDESTPMGVWLYRFEKKRPIDIIDEDDPLYGKKMSTLKYITAWIVGHICKMVGAKNSYNKIYEEELAKFRVDRPELADEDDEEFLYDIFEDVDIEYSLPQIEDDDE